MKPFNILHPEIMLLGIKKQSITNALYDNITLSPQALHAGRSPEGCKSFSSQ